MNDATPATAKTAVVPERLVAPGFVEIAVPTSPVKLMSVAPRKSVARTVMLNGENAATLAGGGFVIVICVAVGRVNPPRGL